MTAPQQHTPEMSHKVGCQIVSVIIRKRVWLSPLPGLNGGQTPLMRKGVLSHWAILAMVLVFVAPAVRAQAGWTEFVHPEHGFAIRYPSDWEALPVGPMVPFAASSPSGSGRSHVNVIVSLPMPVEAGTQPEQFNDELNAVLQEMLKGLELIRTEPIAAENVSGIVQHYTLTWREVTLYQIRAIFVSQQTAYVLQGTAVGGAPSTEDDVALILRIFRTFRVKAP